MLFRGRVDFLWDKCIPYKRFILYTYISGTNPVGPSHPVHRIQMNSDKQQAHTDLRNVDMAANRILLVRKSPSWHRRVAFSSSGVEDR